MLKIIVLLVIFYLIYRLLKSVSGKASGRGKSKPSFSEAPRQIKEMVQDPVCNIYVPKKDALYLEQGGSRYYFCSQNCLDTFKQRDITK